MCISNYPSQVRLATHAIKQILSSHFFQTVKFNNVLVPTCLPLPPGPQTAFFYVPSCTPCLQTYNTCLQPPHTVPECTRSGEEDSPVTWLVELSGPQPVNTLVSSAKHRFTNKTLLAWNVGHFIYCLTETMGLFSFADHWLPVDGEVVSGLW